MFHFSMFNWSFFKFNLNFLIFVNFFSFLFLLSFLRYEVPTEFFQALSEEEKTACLQFSTAVRATHNKLSKYMTAEGQPACDFLKQVRIFNPKPISFMSKEIADYNAIPDMEIVPAHEFALMLLRLQQVLWILICFGNQLRIIFRLSRHNYMPLLCALLQMLSTAFLFTL